MLILNMHKLSDHLLEVDDKKEPLLLLFPPVSVVVSVVPVPPVSVVPPVVVPPVSVVSVPPVLVPPPVSVVSVALATHALSLTSKLSAQAVHELKLLYAVQLSIFV